MGNYDLEARTFEFSKRLIKLCKEFPSGVINNVPIAQLMRSGTSIGANYREANETDTKKDFRNRIRITKKEAKETVYWLELILEAVPGFDEKITPLLEESRQFVKIFVSIYNKCPI